MTNKTIQLFSEFQKIIAKLIFCLPWAYFSCDVEDLTITYSENYYVLDFL